MIEKLQQEKGNVDPKFKNNHKLTTSTTPVDYADIFLPFSRNIQGNKEMISFEKITKWKNLKVVISGDFQGGTCYPCF